MKNNLVPRTQDVYWRYATKEDYGNWIADSDSFKYTYLTGIVYYKSDGDKALVGVRRHNDRNIVFLCLDDELEKSPSRFLKCGVHFFNTIKNISSVFYSFADSAQGDKAKRFLEKMGYSPLVLHQGEPLYKRSF